MGIALGGSGLTMPEHLANDIEAVAAGYGDRGEAVPKVMNADIVESGRRPDALPGLLDADEMSVAAFGGKSVSERADAPSGNRLSRAAKPHFLRRRSDLTTALVVPWRYPVRSLREEVRPDLA